MVFLDDDDSWDERFLATTVGFLNANRWCGGVAAETFQIEEDIADGTIRMAAVKPWNPGLADISLFDVGAWANPFSLNAFVFRRACLDRVARFDESLAAGEDFDFFLRFVEHFDIAALPEPLAFSHCRTIAPPAYLCPGKLDGGEDVRAMVRDGLLRRELANGRMGVGLLSALSAMNQTVANRLIRYRSLVDYLGQQRKEQGSPQKGG